MDRNLRRSYENLASGEDAVRMKALQVILEATRERVDWAGEVWDDLVDRLEAENSYQRAIAVKVLCSLAKSVPEARVEAVLERLLAHTGDEKFVTSRQCLQSIWKVAAAGDRIREKVLRHLEAQFADCVQGRHYNLIRQDILQSMRNLYDCTGDSGLLHLAQNLAAREVEEKYRKKYAAILTGS
jgi:hypothetical protein